MDLQATAQLLGNFGEFFGAIAVVITLIYLAGQLRQNTIALRSASYEHWNQVSSSFTDFYARFAEGITEIEHYSSIEELSPEQRKLMLALSVQTIDQAQTSFLQHRAGTLDDDVFDARIASFIGFVELMPLLKQQWRSGGRDYPTAAFRTYIEGRVPSLVPDAD